MCLLLLMAVALAGCTGAAEPKKKTVLRVYSALENEELLQFQEDVWEREHPHIDLDIYRASTGVLTRRLFNERDDPQADVIWGLATTSLILFSEEGMLEGYAPPDLDTIKKRFYDQKHIPPRWIGIKAWMISVVCNSLLMAEKGLPYPETYRDLLNPRYRNALVVPDPRSSGTGFMFVSGILQMMGEEKGWEYLERLNGNVHYYAVSGEETAKLAGKGKCTIAVSFAYRGYVESTKGAPLKEVFLKEGSGWDLDSVAIVKKDRIKPEAMVFIEWAISSQMINLYAKSYPLITAKGVRVHAPSDVYPADPYKQLVENNLYWAANHRQAILERWVAAGFDRKSLLTPAILDGRKKPGLP